MTDVAKTVVDDIKTAGKTAITRYKLSAPMRHWLRTHYLDWPCFALHFGAGKAHADDIALNGRTLTFKRHDPNHGSSPAWNSLRYDAIVCNYVMNTLPPVSRREAWKTLCRLTHERGHTLVAVRGDAIKGTPEYDGVRTSKGTFQKCYTENELFLEASAVFNRVIVYKKSGTIYAVCSRPARL